MKTAKFLIAALALFHFASPAAAGENGRSAMRYTTLHQTQEKQENAALRSIEFENSATGGEEAVEEPAQSTWERYKALAAGKSVEEADEIARNDDKPTKMQQVRTPDPAPPRPAAATETTGLVGLIKQYQENKQKQGGMRSMTISSPKAVHERHIADKDTQGSSEQSPPPAE